MQTEARGLPKPSRCTFPKFEHQTRRIWEVAGGRAGSSLLDRPVGLPEKTLSCPFTLVTDGTDTLLVAN